MTKSNRSFGSKCNCGHLESDHKPQTVDSLKSVMRFQVGPEGRLPMGMAPNISYDARRAECKICNCQRFEYTKRWGFF